MKTFKVNNAQRLRFTDGRQQLHVYNGLDGLTTIDLLERMRGVTNPTQQLAVDYEHAMLGPVMTIMRRGILIDKDNQPAALASLEKDIALCVSALREFVSVVWAEQAASFNYRSVVQVRRLFNEQLWLPKKASLKVVKGDVKESFDGETLKRLAKNYTRCTPFCNLLLRIRDLEKQRDVLTKNLKDWRFHFSHNIAGTNTWRLSSSNDPFGYGQNIQNIDNHIRRQFIPDPGFPLCYLDLQGAEARVVAYLSGDEEYIRTVESQDSHTEVCKLVWPDLGWTLDAEANTKLAKGIFDGTKSYRDMAKRYAHGTNYLGKARTLAIETGTTTKQAEAFQKEYFRAYPGIKDWQTATIGRVQLDGYLVNPFNMKRTFWSRLNDDHTLRTAIAFKPQSTVGVLMCLAIRQVWKEQDGADVQILANIHDALLCQIRTSELDTLLPIVLQLLHIPFPVEDINGTTRTLTIPVESEVGMNWGHHNDDPNKGELNLHGIK